MSKKLRSKTWVVSTHVLTTGLAIPALTGVASAILISQGNIRDPLIALYIAATGNVLGSIGGTLYSLSYLRQSANCVCWTKCTMPSIFAFAILDIAGCTWSVFRLRERIAFMIGILVVSHLVGFVAFAVLTSSGFARLSPVVGAPNERQESVDPSEANNRRGARLRKRLLGACVGFIVGFAVGFFVIMYMHFGGGSAQTTFQTKILTGLAVAGIGALLGFVFGVPQV